jgi:hypothetical protein
MRRQRESTMLRAIIRQEWRDHPGKVIAATVAAVLAPFLIWAWYVVVVETLKALGVPE